MQLKLSERRKKTRKCIISLMHTGELQEIIQLNMKIMLLLTHPHIIPHLHGCLKRYYSLEYNAQVIWMLYGFFFTIKIQVKELHDHSSNNPLLSSSEKKGQHADFKRIIYPKMKFVMIYSPLMFPIQTGMKIKEFWFPLTSIVWPKI